MEIVKRKVKVSMSISEDSELQFTKSEYEALKNAIEKLDGAYCMPVWDNLVRYNSVRLVLE